MSGTEPRRERNDPYTFGDGDLARLRLARLAELYEPSSRELLLEHAPRRPARAIDLGCGPGHTTRMLASLLRPGALVGLDASPRYVEIAREDAPEGARFELHDVTTTLPTPRAELLYCRFLLTHLATPRDALDVWYDAASEGAVLLVEEVQDLRADDPAIRRYYELVAAMQAYHGQTLHIGRALDAHARATRWSVRESRARELALPASRMARLHEMNLATWRHGAFARASCDARELDALAERLAAIAEDDGGAVVRCDLRQLVLAR